MNSQPWPVPVEAGLLDTETTRFLWIGLAALSVLIALRVAWAGRSNDSDLRSLLRHAVAAGWLAPALVVIALVGVQAATRLAPPQRPDSPITPTTTITSVILPLHGDPGHSWTRASISESSRMLVPIASGPWSTAKEARQDAMQKARLRLVADFEQISGYAGEWELPLSVVERAIRRRTQSTQDHRLRPRAPSSQMHYCVVQLELSETTHRLVFPVWRRQIGGERVQVIGLLIGLLGVLILTAHAFLRLDIATTGTHRGKLQVAAVSLMAAAGLVASGLLGQ